MTRLVVLGVVAGALAALASALWPAAAQARTPAPRLRDVRCVPPTAVACRDGRVRVAIGRAVQLRGRSLRFRMRVTFRWSLGALSTRLRRTRAGFLARVPAGTRAGTVSLYVTDAAGRRSNRVRIVVTAPPAVRAPVPPRADARGLPAAFAGGGMWIWQLPRSDGGDVDRIAARAKAARIGTVFVKAGDGTTAWTQFTSELVAALHERGLRACAWQYVYGKDPEGEAAVSAEAVARGADCFVIDAESEYQGRYAQAQRYLRALRARIGADYPLGLTSFAYVDYHPGLPYSVFLGPGGAQVDVPQVYWKDIGDTVDAASAHAFAHNRIFGVPIAPLGQTYGSPAPAELTRFRALWSAYGAGGLSWWSWQATQEGGWMALGQPDPARADVPDPGWPLLKRGSKGDEVVWLQEHLASYDRAAAADGEFGAGTDRVLRSFQQSRGLPPTGQTDDATWREVLGLPLVAPDWAGSGSGARAARVHAPWSAQLPARPDGVSPPAQRG